jgi:hypothetical protein
VTRRGSPPSTPNGPRLEAAFETWLAPENFDADGPTEDIPRALTRPILVATDAARAARSAWEAPDPVVEQRPQRHRIARPRAAIHRLRRAFKRLVLCRSRQADQEAAQIAQGRAVEVSNSSAWDRSSRRATGSGVTPSRPHRAAPADAARRADVRGSQFGMPRATKPVWAGNHPRPRRRRQRPMPPAPRPMCPAGWAREPSRSCMVRMRSRPEPSGRPRSMIATEGR